MVRNGSHQFNCKKCGKLIKFSEILSHKKECSPNEFKEHQSKSGKIGATVLHKIYPNLAKEQWEKYLSPLKGEKHGMYGKHQSENAKLLIGKANKGKLVGNKNPAKRPEIREKISKNQIGELNPNWQGGSSFEPYCEKWTLKFRESIRLRDNYTCQLCGKTQSELIGYHKKHTVHHIHYDKKNCYPDCITLCNRCNIIVNKKSERKNYENLFMNNLNNRNLLFWAKRSELI